jgi:hypothetical protein
VKPAVCIACGQPLAQGFCTVWAIGKGDRIIAQYSSNECRNRECVLYGRFFKRDRYEKLATKALAGVVEEGEQL